MLALLEPVVFPLEDFKLTALEWKPMFHTPCTLHCRSWWHICKVFLLVIMWYFTLIISLPFLPSCKFNCGCLFSVFGLILIITARIIKKVDPSAVPYHGCRSPSDFLKKWSQVCSGTNTFRMEVRSIGDTGDELIYASCWTFYRILSVFELERFVNGVIKYIVHLLDDNLFTSSVSTHLSNVALVYLSVVHQM